MTEIDSRLSRRRFLQASAAVGATVSLGGITAACNVVGQTAQGGTFNWMTWGDHYIDTQLKAIEASDKITANISELSGNAEGFAKLKEVKGQLDMVSADALWLPDADHQEGLEALVSSSASHLRREIARPRHPSRTSSAGFSPIRRCLRRSPAAHAKPDTQRSTSSTARATRRRRASPEGARGDRAPAMEAVASARHRRG